jgi:hypothetical protein
MALLAFLSCVLLSSFAYPVEFIVLPILTCLVLFESIEV